MIGQVLLQYRIVEKIGEGGQGTVYRAVDTTLDRPAVVKVLPPELTDSASKLAEAHTALGFVSYWHLAATGRLNEAVAEANTAHELEPFALTIYSDYIRGLYHAARWTRRAAKLKAARNGSQLRACLLRAGPGTRGARKTGRSDAKKNLD